MARPRTFDEETVVEAARDRFWTYGYSATSLDDLVKATGLTKGSIYNTFGDKHTLYVRAFESYCHDVVGRFSSNLDGPDEAAAERLRTLVRRIADTAGTESATPLACFLAKATAELAGLDPEVAVIGRRAFGQLEDALVRCVAAARRAGALPDCDDPRSTARHVLVALRGFDALAAAGVDRAVLVDAATSLTRSLLGAVEAR